MAILKRPMFRKGGSANEGIMSGLQDRSGYANGGTIGGGNISGQPMTDGRYGFADPLWIAEAKKNWPGMTLGSETLNNEWMIKGQPIYGPDSPHGMQPNIGRSGLDVDYLFKPEGAGEGEFQTLNLGDIYSEDLAADREEKERAEAAGVDVETLTAIEKENEGLAEEGEIETSKVWVSDMVDGVPQKTGKWVEKPKTKTKSALELDNERLRAELAQALKGDNIGESIDIDKETYLKALGGDKAMGQDISDMLLSAGSKFLKPGATVKGGFSEFLEDEAKKGPGRSEKLKQAAAMLAIKDSIASKRSTEQLEKLLGIETFRSKLGSKNLAENITLAGKTYNPGSVKAIEMGFKMTYPTAIIIRQPDANYTPDPGDEGKYILEEDTKTVWKITDGNKQKVW